MIFDTISVKARWERWCRWNCDLRVINARKKGIFCRTESVAMTPKSRDHMPTTSLWGVAEKRANSSSEDWYFARETHKDTAVSVWRQDLERVSAVAILDSSVSFEANPKRYSMGFAKSHSLKCSLHKWAWCGAARKSARLNCINLIHFRSTKKLTMPAYCGIVKFFFDHTHTQFTEESKMATALTPQTDVTSGKVTWLMENLRL